ncbi:MAG TPA: cupin domain-containing protein [Thermoanaerobaculia bacterium]|nr:cupin domain-containing protein [Thermoanaerobaculia bacterium]
MAKVTRLKDGEPVHDGALTIWNHFAGTLSLRVLELDGAASLRNESAEEVLYVLSGDGNYAPETGIYLPPGDTLSLSGKMVLVSARCEGYERSNAEQHVVSLHDCAEQRTGDRWYRELIRTEVTQFVGGIPPGRAPDHYHLYEEVICILSGEGVMHGGGSSSPIGAGSCIFLPRCEVHCVENTSNEEMQLLGVFYPAGSPAVRYGVD